MLKSHSNNHRLIFVTVKSGSKTKADESGMRHYLPPNLYDHPFEVFKEYRENGIDYFIIRYYGRMFYEYTFAKKDCIIL